MFSPYYAWARRGGNAEPLDHCALNVALYGPGSRWTMTERGRRSVHAERDALAIGPSSLRWDGAGLTIAIDEIAVPLPVRVRGRVRVMPSAPSGLALALDGRGRHRWWPLAPCARVEVALDRPRLRWSGGGYLDANAGDEPLEAAFSRWTWSRAALREGAAVLYDVALRDRAEAAAPIALRFDGRGSVQAFAPPPMAALPPTLWRMRREARSENAVGVERTLEDAPFYARSQLTAELLGERVTAMHESLSLDRFRSPWVQAMLPFRMPRCA